MNGTKTVPELFGDLVSHLSTLFRKEVQLARAEVSEKVNQATSAVVYMAIGAVFLLAALMVLLDSLVIWLAVWGIEIRWSTLVVGIVVALIGYVLLHKGMSNVRASNLTPNRTVEQLQRDAHVVKEQVR